MTEPHRPCSRRRRPVKPRVRRLRFECYEERVLLTTTPLSDLLAAAQADLNTIPADLVLVDHSTDSAASGPAPADGDPPRVTEVVPQPVQRALDVNQRGEGGFERLRLSGGSTPRFGIAYNSQGFSLGDVSLYVTADTDDFRTTRTGGGLLDVTRASTVLNGTIGTVFDAAEVFREVVTEVAYTFEFTDGNAAVDGAPKVQLDDASNDGFLGAYVVTAIADALFGGTDGDGDLDNILHLEFAGGSFEDRGLPSPSQSVLALAQVLPDEAPARESQLAQGEGEFVRLSLSTPAERLELRQTPDASAIRIASHAGPTPTPLSQPPAILTIPARRIVSSAAWDVQLLPVSKVALAFDVSEGTTTPNAPSPSSPEESRDSLPVSVGGGTRPSPAPADQSPILPPEDTVSFQQSEKLETGSADSHAYVAVSPVLAAIAGSLLVKDRWQKLQPREEEHLRKPR